MLINSHCHLDYFTAGRDWRTCWPARRPPGVGEMVTIGTRLTQSAEVRALAEAHANVWCTVGVHPHNAAEAPVPDAGGDRGAEPRIRR